jgi:hypothetical protein
MRATLLNLTVIASLLAAASGCAASAHGGQAGAIGVLFSDYQAPGEIGSGEVSPKKGEACVTSILGFIATGDASITAAAAQGGITRISHVDHANLGVLGVYAKTCTIVYGK